MQYEKGRFGKDHSDPFVRQVTKNQAQPAKSTSHVLLDAIFCTALSHQRLCRINCSIKPLARFAMVPPQYHGPQRFVPSQAWVTR